MAFSPINIKYIHSVILDNFDSVLDNIFADGAGIGVNIGQMSRTGSTVTVNTVVTHNFNPGDTVVLSPGETNFPVGSKTIVSTPTTSSFTYTESGVATSNAAAQVFVHKINYINKYSDDYTMSSNTGDSAKATSNRDLTRSAFRTVLAAIMATYENWHEVSSLLNSWVYFGSGNTPAYCINPIGEVRLKGWIKNGTVGTAAFQLPTGYRPMATSSFPVITYDGVNTGMGQVQIDISGNVNILNPSSNPLVSLDSINFRAAQ